MTTTGGLAASQESHPARLDRPNQQTGLDSRYGAIGIVAVAAAARYAGNGKTVADAPASSQIDQRFIERAD